MTTLTLRVNLYDKTLEPALAGEPETIAVGETVRLRLLGTGLPTSAADIAALNKVVASDAVTPPLRARIRHDSMGDIAIFPFPGDDPSQGNGWYAEDVGGETAICCNIDLGTAQAYGLFGGAPLPDGVSRKVRLLVERSFPNEGPTLYASDLLRVGSWSFPGHELRFLGRPKGTDVSIDDVQNLVNGAVAAFQSEVSGMRSGMVEDATRIANAISGISSSGAAAVVEALSGMASGIVDQAASAVQSGLRGAVMVEGDQTVTGEKTFVGGILLKDASGLDDPLPVTVEYDGCGQAIVFNSGFATRVGDIPVGLYWGDRSSGNRLVCHDELMSGVSELARVLGYEYNVSYMPGVEWAPINDGTQTGIGQFDIGRLNAVLCGAMSGFGFDMYSGSGSDTPIGVIAALTDALAASVEKIKGIQAGLGIDGSGGGGGGEDSFSICDKVAECLSGQGFDKDSIRDEIQEIYARISGMTTGTADITELTGRLQALESKVWNMEGEIDQISPPDIPDDSGNPDDQGNPDIPPTPPFTPPIMPPLDA